MAYYSFLVIATTEQASKQISETQIVTLILLVHLSVALILLVRIIFDIYFASFVALVSSSSAPISRRRRKLTFPHIFPLL